MVFEECPNGAGYQLHKFPKQFLRKMKEVDPSFIIKPWCGQSNDKKNH